MYDLKMVNSLINEVYQLIKKTINNLETDGDWQALLDEGNRIVNKFPDLEKLASNLILGYMGFMEKQNEKKKQGPVDA